ncbi:MAG TPA: hypothetical protein VKK61_03570, partial [Tepidisphaeraceae bacterium]|nr:hypothetical protein [Tepidisphaeraceae bacterium]
MIAGVGMTIRFIIQSETTAHNMIWGCYGVLGIAGGIFLGIAEYRVNRRKKRRVAGLCPWCGYDIRASKECCP